MQAFEDREDVYTSPISTGDASAMLRRRVQKNDRPYIAETTTLNNRMVDDWKTSVLDQIADSRGTVPSGRVWESWRLYNEGKGILKYHDLKEKGMILETLPEVLEFWKDFFEHLNVDEMHAYGSGTVSYGWGIIQNYFAMWYSDQKYEALFGKFDTPLEWEQNHHNHTALLTGEVLPFWTEEILKDIQQKIAAVLLNDVKPQGGSGFN